MAVIRSILSFSLLLQFVATAATLRELRPIHKAGARVITRIANLRPISLACELAAVQDGLFLLCHRQKLIAFWGPNQCGWIYEVLASVLCLLILLGEGRIAYALLLLLGFGDL